jgi:hypothetical protein
MQVALPVAMATIRKRSEEGRVVVPILLWLLGVPFTIVLLLWLFFFRG